MLPDMAGEEESSGLGELMAEAAEQPSTAQATTRDLSLNESNVQLLTALFSFYPGRLLLNRWMSCAGALRQPV